VVPEDTFICEITTRVRDEGRAVQLRCGLDAALWDEKEASQRCRDLLKAAHQLPIRNPE
jgi:hypothetical protein